MANLVAGELYESITGQLFEIGRQLRQPNGYPFNPDLLKLHLQAAIVGRFGENTVSVPFRFQPWKTIKLGLCPTSAAYRAALKTGGFKIGIYADQILDKTTIAPTVVEVDISKPFTVRDIGFTENTRYDAICKRIVKLGGQLCPDEVGPATRLQYLDQPKGEWFRTAMKALAGSDDVLGVFNIARDVNGQWLHSNSGHPFALYYPVDQFVCVLPRK